MVDVFQSAASTPASAGVSARTRQVVLCVVGVVATVTLVLNAGAQIYDANLFVLAEATSLLAGDVPGRDFLTLGTPLESYLAAAAQLLSGGRLIGEFLRQWIYIVSGTVIAFHLGLRLSRSAGATLVMLIPAVVILANTPTYHASKLLFFPLFVWLAWRYLDRPNVRRSAVLGVVSALAFLSRHDYAFYLGFGSCVALAAARFAVPACRDSRSILRDGGAYVAAVMLVLAPWIVSVQLTEGVAEYTRMRALLYEQPKGTPYSSLLHMNPVRELMPEPLPAPVPAVIGFVWRPDIDEPRQRDLEQQYGLSKLDGRDERNRVRYQVATAYDVNFLKLEPFIRDPIGIPWDRLSEARTALPSQPNVNLWLQQVALAVPLVLLAAGGWMAWRKGAARVEAWRMIVAGAFLAVVNGALFREPGYVVVTVPILCALSARFLVSPGIVGRAFAIIMLFATLFAAAVWARRAPMFLPSEVRGFLSSASERLFASPPAAAEPKYRYIHDCSADGDRVLITGATPSLVSYYANRPMAGGHSYWHHGWLSTPAHEARSLAQLQQQSVPFVVSTHDAVLDDFKKYPHIRAYLEQNYTALDGTNGRVLVDTRRQPTGRFGPQGYPCFARAN